MTLTNVNPAFSLAPLSWFAAAALPFATATAEEHHDHDDDHDEDGHSDVRAAGDHDEHEVDEFRSPGLFGVGVSAVDWAHGEGVNIGGIFFPEFFLQGVFGDSTTDPASLAVGHHDPQTQAMLQSVHLAGFLKVGDFLTGFVNYEGTTDANGEYEGVLEEGFAHIHLSDRLAIGGGQFLNSFGYHNEPHIHSWDFVDQNLVNGRMLNEGELTTRGGEVIIDLPTQWESTLTIGGGGLATHDEGDEHHGHASHDDVGLPEPAFDPEGGNFDAWVVSANYLAEYGSHEHMSATLSAAVGKNGFGETTQVYGIGHEIVWNPPKPLYDDTKSVVIGNYRGGTFGSGSLLWRTEAMVRRIEAVSIPEHHEEEGEHHDHEEEDEEGPRSATLDEFGFYSIVQYGINDLTTAGLRGEWVSGIDEMGLEDRWRVSPTVGIYLNNRRSIHLRLQYNYDYSEVFGNEHSIWLQVSIAWGASGDHSHHHH